MPGLDIVKESLLAELEALDSKSGDELKQEIGRARAKCDVAEKVNAYVANQIAVSKLVIQTKLSTSDEVATALNGLLEAPGGS